MKQGGLKFGVPNYLDLPRPVILSRTVLDFPHNVKQPAKLTHDKVEKGEYSRRTCSKGRSPGRVRRRHGRGAPPQLRARGRVWRCAWQSEERAARHHATRIWYMITMAGRATPAPRLTPSHSFIPSFISDCGITDTRI